MRALGSPLLPPRLRATAVLLVLLVAAGCGGSTEPGSGAGGASSSTPEAVASPDVDDEVAVEATLGVIDTEVDVRAATSQQFQEGTDGTALRIGDTVRTDAAGFGEIRHEDGALTRVDADSTVTLAALQGDAGAPDIELELDVGRVWNRVAATDGARNFAVSTDVGTAAVRGTAFEVDCRPVLAGACLFAVYEGTVEVAPTDAEAVLLGPFEYVVVAADGTIADRGTVAADLTTPDVIDGDWVRRNAERDEQQGAAPIDGLEPEPSTALAFGDIYDCGSAGGGATSYMRFFEDGEVIAVSSTGTAEQVSSWFVRPSEDPDFDNSVGTYTVVDGQVEGSTTSQSEEASDITVSFAGTLAEDGTLSLTTSSTNGNVSEVTCAPVLEG